MSCYSEFRVTWVPWVPGRLLTQVPDIIGILATFTRIFDDVCIRAYKLKRNRRRNQVPDITGILPIITKTFL